MRYQKPSRKDLPKDLLDGYNPQEIEFAFALAAGEKQYIAYQKAYGEKDWNRNTLDVQACRKAAEVNELVCAIKGLVGSNKLLTLAEAISDEEAFAQRAEAAGQFGAAGAARDRRNKMLGHYVDKLEINDVTDVRAQYDEIAKISPDLAQQWAKEKGVVIH